MLHQLLDVYTNQGSVMKVGIENDAKLRVEINNQDIKIIAAFPQIYGA